MACAIGRKYVDNTMLDFQQIMTRDRSRVIRFQNVDGEDFTHSFDGYPWTIKAGESQYFPVQHARLFAKHLARKILMRQKKGSPEGRMDGAILFKDDDMNSLMGKILGQAIDLPSDERTPQDVYKQRVQEINETLGAKVSESTVELSKAEIISRLAEKDVKFDARSSKDKLLELLNENK